MQNNNFKNETANGTKTVLGSVKYEFYLHDGTLIYSCKTEEKKNKYENQLKAKQVKYTLKVLGS
jgi:hypothetical protein